MKEIETNIMGKLAGGLCIQYSKRALFRAGIL